MFLIALFLKNVAMEKISSGENMDSKPV